MTPHVNITEDHPTVTIGLTLGTIVGDRCLDPGSHDEPPVHEPITLLDAIVDRAAEQLIELTVDEGWRSLASRVQAIRDEMIREQLKPMIDAAVDAPIQRTSNYGAPMSEPVTMRQLVIDAVHAEATKALRTTNARYDSDKSLLDRLVEQTVPKVLTKDLAAEIEAAKQTLRDAIKESASQALADALTSTLSTGR